MFPALGTLDTSAGLSSYLGLGAALRVGMKDLPLFAEAELARASVPSFDTATTSASLAAGFRRPRGHLSPVLVGEVGLQSFSQLETLTSMSTEPARTADRTGAFAGLGGGLELWFRRTFVIADARWRRAFRTSSTWKVDGTEVDVDKPFVEENAFVVRVSAGYRL